MRDSDLRRIGRRISTWPNNQITVANFRNLEVAAGDVVAVVDEVDTTADSLRTRP
jgi:hypothetical protein